MVSATTINYPTNIKYKEKVISPNLRLDSSPELKLTILIKMKTHHLELTLFSFHFDEAETNHFEPTFTATKSAISAFLEFSSHNCRRSQLIVITRGTNDGPKPSREPQTMDQSHHANQLKIQVK